MANSFSASQTASQTPPRNTTLKPVYVWIVCIQPGEPGDQGSAWCDEQKHTGFLHMVTRKG